MKRILAVLGLALLLLIAILCVRASRVKSRQVQAPLVTDLTLAGGTDTKHYLPLPGKKKDLKDCKDKHGQESSVSLKSVLSFVLAVLAVL